MPNLPGNFASESVALIQLDSVPYEYATRVGPRELRAFSKFEETERRLIVFEWATFALPNPRGHQRFLQDLASAYLLSFEAVFQILCDELGKRAYEQLLSDRETYTLECRGLRTLRLLEAHVGPSPLARRRLEPVVTRFSGSTLGGTTAWSWPPIAEADLQALESPKIRANELRLWNARTQELAAIELMRAGLSSLRSIFRLAQQEEARR